MMVWSYIEIGICLALLVVLFWLEARRPDRRRLAWRVAATVVAVAALAGLILPLTYRHSVKVAALQPPALVAGPVRSAGGVVAVSWQRRLFAGERLRVQGRWQGAGEAGAVGEGAGDRSGRGRRVKLLLMGLGTVLDSANANGDFSLETAPAQTGRAVYRLVATDGADTLEQEAIPVEAGHGLPLKILILAASPDFENTFLVNWLAKNGQQVAMRTTVSRNNYQSSFVNMAPRSLDRLTSVLLDEFDIVIADSLALPGVGDAGLRVLTRQVEEKGLGLIVRTDSAYLRKKPGMRSFATDSLSRTLVGGSFYGVGKVVYTTMNTTYVRMMAGQSASYAAYWSSLLRRVGREAEVKDDWQLEPAEPRVGEQTGVLLRTVKTGQPQGLAGGNTGSPVSVYLAQDEVLSFDWRGRYWPGGAGWQELRTFEGDTTWAYVWPRGAWPALYRERQREAMGYGGTGKGVAEAAKGGDAGDEVRPIPKYWFYIFFLLSVLFLWVERKIGGMSGKIIQ
jgi:hypothetical protein